MSQRRLSVLCVAAAVLLPASAVACLWDYDTLQMERNRFPSALELITGKFLRHTPEFYDWRISDRLKKLKYDPENLAYYDDLAVAYEKTGQHEKAIETILIKDKKKPGLYETEANLSTFLIHAGRLEEGLQHIDKALRINPDAHFGREKFQKRLVEYVLSRRRDGKTPLPLVGPSDPHDSFRTFLIVPATATSPPRIDESERKAAVKGVLGMMRFGNHDSPVLLEALGDLLRNERGIYGKDFADEKQLAARAYLKASYAVNEETSREAYGEKARMALCFQAKYRNSTEQLPLEELEESFRQELAQADEWYAELRNNELTWIKEGKDPEQEFSRRYYEEPRVIADPSEQLPVGPLFQRRLVRMQIALGGILLLIMAPPVLIFVRWWRARRARSAAVTEIPPLPTVSEGIRRP
jgi:tetratricopeptide (TPR) repeat protein